MTLKYNILWLEDAPEYIDSLKPALQDHLSELGFEFGLHSAADDTDLIKSITDNDIDLILVDQNLSGKKKGEKLIDAIRQNEIYIDVIFYSQYAGLREKTGEKLEGVFYAERDNLKEKTLKVIDRTIKRQQEINNMRGVIVAETIDIEKKMDTFIMKYFGADNEKKNVIEKVLDPEFEALSPKKKFDLINKICKEKIKSLADLHQKADPEKKDTFQKIKSSIESKKSQFINVYEEIIEVRNIMAHAEESAGSKNTLVSHIRKNEPICVDDKFCKGTRKNIKKHADNLDALIKDFESLIA